MPDNNWLCCGVLRKEIEKLHKDGKISGKCIFLDSMLHMNPECLESLLNEKIKSFEQGKVNTVLVYGDCCSGMFDLSQKKWVERVDYINCAQLILGKNRYRQLMKEQAFILLPEWLKRWKEIFSVELGLSKEIATNLMQENRNILVYLDSGQEPIPEKEIHECSEYVGLPVKIEKVSLENLLAAMNDAAKTFFDHEVD